jgi:hypothetical protein
MTLPTDRPLIAQLRQTLTSATSGASVVPLQYTAFLAYRKLHHGIRALEREMEREPARLSFFQAQREACYQMLDTLDAISDAIEADDFTAVEAAILKLEVISRRID